MCANFVLAVVVPPCMAALKNVPSLMIQGVPSIAPGLFCVSFVVKFRYHAHTHTHRYTLIDPHTNSLCLCPGL